MSVYARGRMLTQDISESHKIASLSKESLILFFMIVPHLDSHGKINGEPHFIKGKVVPLLKYFTIDTIKVALREISKKTNMKWFKSKGLYYIHSISFTEHQNLNPKKIGRDELPSYSEVIPELASPEVEVEVECEVEVEGEVKPLKLKPEKTGLRPSFKENGNGYDKTLIEEICCFFNDEKSRGFYIQSARKLGDGLLREIFGDVQSRIREKNDVENPAGYFADQIKRELAFNGKS